MELEIIHIARMTQQIFTLVSGKTVKSQAWVSYITKMDRSLTVIFKMTLKMDLANQHIKMVVHMMDSLETI